MISTIDQNGKKLICSHELYKKVGYANSQYSRWVKREIVGNATKGIDYFDYPFVENSKRGPGNIHKFRKKYLITFDFAVAICLMSKTEIAKKLKIWLQIHKND